MSRKQAECLLAAVIFARSTSLLCAGVTLLGVGFRPGRGIVPAGGLFIRRGNHPYREVFPH